MRGRGSVSLLTMAGVGSATAQKSATLLLSGPTHDKPARNENTESAGLDLAGSYAATAATIVISMRAPAGSADTSTVVRPGGACRKYSP